MQLINKAAVMAKIKKIYVEEKAIFDEQCRGGYEPSPSPAVVCMKMEKLRSFLDTLETIDPYEQRVQYDSIKAGIQAHAETYSFNIQSELFNQLTKEQQKLWRKEIEQACISGGEVGVELARDIRYKENLEVKEIDLEKEIQAFSKMELEPIKIYDANVGLTITMHQLYQCAKHFFELGLNTRKEN